MCAESSPARPTSSAAVPLLAAPSPLPSDDRVTVAVFVNDAAWSDAMPLRAIAIRSSGGAEVEATVSLATDQRPTDVLVGDRLRIEAGYGDVRQPIFAGVVRGVTFQLSAGARGVVFGIVGRGEPMPPAGPGPVLTLTYGVEVCAAELSNATVNDPCATTGTMRFPGSALVRAGDTVALAGFPEGFDGVVPVQGVAHTLADGNWETTIELGTATPPSDDLVLADGHGNRVTLDAQGITLSSAGKIALDGNAVALAATTTVTVCGQATAEISSSGETVVRGAMVRIN